MSETEVDTETGSEKPSGTVRSQEGDLRPGGVLGAALGSALLFSIAVTVPYLPLLSTIAPFPLILQRLRTGPGGALMAAFLSSALLAAALSPGQALGFLAVLAGPGLLIGEAMARGRGLLKGCGWAFVLLATEIGVALVFAGPQMAARVLQPLDQYRSPQFLEELRASGLPPERVEDWGEQFAALHRIVSVVYPAAYVIMGALVVLLNAALLRSYLARRDPGWLEEGEFERVRWPLGLVVVFVAAGGTLLFPSLRSAGYNVLLLTAFFFALQGLAVVAYYAHRLAGPPFLRAAVVILVLVNPWAPQILALLGLFDTWFDFRKWADPPATAG